MSFESRSGEVYSIQHYVIKFVSDLLQVSAFLRVAGFLHRYNWNIVESGVKHHKTKSLSMMQNNFSTKYKDICMCI